MDKTIIFRNPLIDHKITILKERTTTNDLFRRTLKEISTLLITRVLADVKTAPKIIQTPIAMQTCQIIAQDIIIIMILRAGLTLGEAFINMIPNCKIGFAGFERDEKTLKAKNYQFKLPKIKPNSQVIILDPMIATGNTSLATIKKLKQQHKVPMTIKLIGILGTKKALANIHNAHNDVQIFLAKEPEELNNNGYIVPGLGDAGDRLFNTE